MGAAPPDLAPPPDGSGRPIGHSISERIAEFRLFRWCHAQTGSWPTPVRRRNVQLDYLGISGGRIRANNRGVVFHP
jgi:hypothetical protein